MLKKNQLFQCYYLNKNFNIYLASQKRVEEANTFLQNDSALIQNKKKVIFSTQKIYKINKALKCYLKGKWTAFYI